ncbi:MAG: 50S ribosomal protein L29 [Chlamydiae bacterium]|nr:50S ribosomal protein L29 [Chlamydiota bacterium]
MLTMSELMGLSKEDLQAQYTQISGDIFKLKNTLRISRKLEKPHELKQKKKDRARVLTALNKKLSAS